MVTTIFACSFVFNRTPKWVHLLKNLVVIMILKFHAICTYLVNILIIYTNNMSVINQKEGFVFCWHPLKKLQTTCAWDNLENGVIFSKFFREYLPCHRSHEQSELETQSLVKDCVSARHSSIKIALINCNKCITDPLPHNSFLTIEFQIKTFYSNFLCS